ncbi:hypothetical protein CerSpe_241110 [Prunus speciosa]
MSCFLLPKNFCSDLEQLMAKFWWGQHGDRRKIHWMRWGKLGLPKSEGGLGFISLYAFNLAMLAKQGWRLLHNPDSLISKLLKARYFPHSSLLDAVPGSKPSFVWSSILSAMKVITRGSRWRVGNGSDIKVWGDRWLPRPTSFEVVTPPVVGLEELKVNSLICEAGQPQWIMPLLTSLFLPLDVDEILRVPLSLRSPPDCLIWHFDRKGKFSVKSAYRVALTLSTDPDPPSSSISGMAQLWKWVWNAKLPEKIKLCTWRGIHDILPTCCALSKRRVSLPHLGCCVCGGAKESTLHILRNCLFAQAVWHLLPGLLSSDRHADLPLPDWLLVSWSELNSNALALSMVVMWALWSNRNDVTWRSTQRQPHDLVQFVLQYMEEFRCANDQPTGSHASLGASCWSWPHSGTIKINFDGAFRTGSTGGGGGVGVLGLSLGTKMGDFWQPLRSVCYLLVLRNMLSAWRLMRLYGFGGRWGGGGRRSGLRLTCSIISRMFSLPR